MRIVGHYARLQHEQAAGSAAIVGDDGGLHAELVRRGGLALPMHSNSGAWKE